MSSVVTVPDRAPAGPCIAPCPVATQARQHLAQLHFSQSASRALARPPLVADIAAATTA